MSESLPERKFIAYLRNFLNLWWIPLMIALEQYADAAVHRSPAPWTFVLSMFGLSVGMAVIDYAFLAHRASPDKRRSFKELADKVYPHPWWRKILRLPRKETLQQSINRQLASKPHLWHLMGIENKAPAVAPTIQPPTGKRMLGSVRLQYSTYNLSQVEKHGDLDMDVVSHVTALTIGAHFSIKFKFSQDVGPFDVEHAISGSVTHSLFGFGMSYKVEKNGLNFVSVEASSGIVTPEAHEVTFWFYTRDETPQICPLEIVFDRANPKERFWSLEPAFDAQGEPAGSQWEYRAAIKNASAKTLRNVMVTVEATGPMPTRPQQSLFDLNKKPVIDLHPGQEALAIIRRWYHPAIVVGMVCGEDMYGPIKMIASADDTPSSTKLFHFDPEKTPMIYEFENG
jgi:hypothetical protein